MRRSLLTALAVPLFLSCEPSGQEDPLPTRPLALTHVTVVDLRDGRLPADRAVVLDGRFLDRQALDGLLAEAERRADPPPE